MKLAKSSGAYRVLHTADWHLGKLLGDLSREDEHTRFLEFLLETIVAEEVDLDPRQLVEGEGQAV